MLLWSIVYLITPAFIINFRLGVKKGKAFSNLNNSTPVYLLIYITPLNIFVCVSDRLRSFAYHVVESDFWTGRVSSYAWDGLHIFFDDKFIFS